MRFPRWRVGLISSGMRNFLAGVIQAGHFDFARDVLKLSSIQELPFIGSSERDSMACQALELDADNCAMYSLLKHWCNQIEVLDQNPEELRETLSRRDVFLSIFMVSCCGLFRVFDTFDKPPPTSWPYLSHPPSRVRRLFLLANAENYIQAEGKAHLFPSHGVVSPERSFRCSKKIVRRSGDKDSMRPIQPRFSANWALVICQRSRKWARLSAAMSPSIPSSHRWVTSSEISRTCLLFRKFRTFMQ